MGQGRFGHDRILSGVIMCHVVGNNGVFPERGSRGPCVGFWGPGSIWQRMWYFCAKFLWMKGVFYHGLCVIIYAGRIVLCLHWYLIRVIGRMTSLEWFSIWEASNNIINFNDVRKRLWKLIWLSKVFLLEIRVDWKGLYARSYWRPDSLERVLCFELRVATRSAATLPLMSHTHSDESAQAQNSSRATTTLVSQPPPPPPPPPHSTDLSLNG